MSGERAGPGGELQGLSATAFLEVIRALDDRTLLARVRDWGPADVVARVFDYLPGLLRPGTRPGVARFTVTADGRDLVHTVRVAAAGAEAAAAAGDARPDAAASTDVVRFLRLLAGQGNPAGWLLTRRLRVSGDRAWLLDLVGHLNRP